MAKIDTAKRTRFVKAVRHGVVLAKAEQKKGKVDLDGVLGALDKALKDAGDQDVTAFELAVALARKIDQGVDLRGISLPTTPPISLELLDGPVVFLIGLGIVLWWRKRQKSKGKEEEPSAEEIETAAAHADAIGHPDIGQLPDPA